MTAYEEVKEIIKNADCDMLLRIMAIVIGAFSDGGRKPEQISFFNKRTKGELKRIIRDFRIMQSKCPEYSDDLEKAIHFIRYDVLKKGTV